MEINEKRKLVSLEEALDSIASDGQEERMLVETGKYLFNIVDSLVNRRRDLGLSQRDMASLTNLKQPAIARFERMEVVPRLDTIVRYATAVGAILEIKYLDLQTEEKSLSKTVTK